MYCHHYSGQGQGGWIVELVISDQSWGGGQRGWLVRR